MDKQKKTVSFDELPRIHVLKDTNNFDREYRKDQTWYFMAIDRHRFEMRVSNFNNRFGYIFSENHRKTIQNYINKHK